jgi:hypothetical protein
MGQLLMSTRERTRLALMVQVRKRALTLQRAAKLLRLSYRQVKRIWRRYRMEGDRGLVHRLRGQPSTRRIDAARRRQILALRERQYPDFGPTLAAEHLARRGLVVDHETLRRWLIADGQWQRQRRRQTHRQWRARRAHRGELVQMDGSHHDWFEGRRASAVLMVMIDDATNHTLARFYEAEDTPAAMDIFGRWVRARGLPLALYADLDSIYRVNRDPSLEEQLAERPAQTQFGRAMAQLGVEIVAAYSPQAKGRVERRHGLFQDRLVKELRLATLATLEQANDFLEQQFLPEINRRFVVPPAQPADLHRRLPRGLVLAEVLSLEDSRVVAADWTVCWQRRYFQIDKQHAALSLPRRRVIVRQLLSGQLQLVYRGQKLRWTELPPRVRPAPAPRVLGQVRRCGIPRADHPWRRYRVRFTPSLAIAAAARRPLSPQGAAGGRNGNGNDKSQAAAQPV